MSLDKAKLHYNDLIKGSKIKIEIPEWDTVVYLRPLQNLSVATASKIKKSIAKDDASGAAEIIHCLATTSDADTGDKLAFGTKADLHDLLHNVNAEVVMRVFITWVEKSKQTAVEEIKEIKK